MSNYFYQVTASVNLLNEKIIHWYMDGTNFKPAGSVSFYVDKARSGGEWEEVGGPIVDNCYYTDPVKWNWNKDLNTFYRIRFLDSSNAWVYSMPIQAFNNWKPKDFAIAKEICRKEYLVMKRFGQQGVLLKRKEWGTPCPVCRDWDTRDVANSNCPTCYGVGIVGGYFAPIDFSMNFQPTSTKRDIHPEGYGPFQQEDQTARAIMYPWVAAYDVWADKTSGDRYTIQTIQVAAQMNGVPLIGVLKLRKLPKTDVVHTAAVNVKANTPPVEQPAGKGNEYTWDKGLDCKEIY